VAWISFNTDIEGIIKALAADADLKAYCLLKFQKEMDFRRVYKKRTEIHLSELPICMITRPSQETTRLTGGLANRDHNLRFYVGFKIDDKVEAQQILIELEERIEQAMFAYDDSSAADEILVIPGDSANDEGHHHPVYFLVKDNEIITEREV
jgi:hypothetical protein